MTYAVVPAISRDAALAAEWLPRIFAAEYDPRFIPAARKRGVTLGMGMTEKQGGSDLRANTTTAQPLGGREYRIVGHKWFFSAPMSDAFLILAQAPGGLSCFFLPRFTRDGAVNAIRLQRLKDKLGDRSNAGSEVEFWGAQATLVGEEGRGVPIILEMGTYCRLDCALGTAGLMRQAVAQALHHAAHRRAFGRRLADQPLMRNVLADLALESEAATALAMRLAGAFDAQADEAQALLRAHPDAGGQVLDLQARPGGGGRSDGGAGRQRLRRGRPAGARLPADAAQLDLGRLGQRHVPRRPAGDGEAPALSRRARRRGRAGGRPRPALRRVRRRPQGRAAPAGGPRVAGAVG